MYLVVWENILILSLPASYTIYKAHSLRIHANYLAVNLFVFHYISSIFSTARVLGRNDLETVLTELQEVRADWYYIGLALKLTHGDLCAIKGPDKKPKDCLRDMILDWLDNSPNSSWESLILALKSPIVGHWRLADHLQTIYCTKKLSTGIGM